jgi:hypothetical protein
LYIAFTHVVSGFFYDPVLKSSGFQSTFIAHCWWVEAMSKIIAKK